MQVEEYYEQIVSAPKPRRGVLGMLKAGQIIFLVLTVITFAAFYLFPISGGTAGAILSFSVPVICLALSLLYRWRRRKLLTDYEYIFSNGDLEIARVIANAKRRKLMTCDVANFEAMGPIADEEGKRLSNMPELQKVIATPDGVATHYAYFNRNGEKTMLMFSPNEKLFGMIQQQNKRARLYQGR